ncbi:MAG: WYL domain-containing protein [Arachnia sp.]
MNRTDRLYALREELRRAGSAGRTAEHLAAHFEVSVRTVKRDISALQQGGFPVWARPGPGGGYVVDAAATLPPVNFTDAEASGLAAAVAAHRGQPFDGDARAALAKVMGAMSASGRQRANELGRRVWVDSADLPDDARTRRAVEQAFQERRVLRLRYHDDDGTDTAATIDPVFLGFTRGRWWVVGRRRPDGDMGWFALDRITAARVTTEPAVDIPVEAAGTPPASAASVAGP